MLSFLKQPYPVRDHRLERAFYQALLSGLLISFILLVFQPFGTYNWHHPYKSLILFGYGLVAVLANLLDFAVSRRFSSSFFAEQHWVIWKEIVRNLAGFIVAGFLCAVYGYWAGLMPFSLPQVIYMIAVCFLIGAFPAIILMLFNYTYLMHKYSKPVLPLQENGLNLVSNDIILELVAENKKDKVTLLSKDLLYITASDNYCSIFYTENEKLSKALLRSSLSRLESQLPVSRITRCHRSYIVNLDLVESVSGNAQGYKLYLHAATEPVPVSRAYTSLLKEHLLVC